jgi:hypothetical protein
MEGDSMNENSFDPSRLPAAIRRYLETPRGPAVTPSAVAEIFTADARVVDERTEYRGTDAIAGWCRTAGSEYTYTTTYLGQGSAAPEQWTVATRLEGNFPGGVADLEYRFRLDGDRIAELVIAP